MRAEVAQTVIRTARIPEGMTKMPEVAAAVVEDEVGMAVTRGTRTSLLVAKAGLHSRRRLTASPWVAGAGPERGITPTATRWPAAPQRAGESSSFEPTFSPAQQL